MPAVGHDSFAESTFCSKEVAKGLNDIITYGGAGQLLPCLPVGQQNSLLRVLQVMSASLYCNCTAAAEQMLGGTDAAVLRGLSNARAVAQPKPAALWCPRQAPAAYKPGAVPLSLQCLNHVPCSQQCGSHVQADVCLLCAGKRESPCCALYSTTLLPGRAHNPLLTCRLACLVLPCTSR